MFRWSFRFIRLLWILSWRRVDGRLNGCGIRFSRFLSGNELGLKLKFQSLKKTFIIERVWMNELRV